MLLASSDLDAAGLTVPLPVSRSDIGGGGGKLVATPWTAGYLSSVPMDSTLCGKPVVECSTCEVP
jgi:hypothetical protein